MGSIWRLDVTIRAPDVDAERGEAIVKTLGEVHRVEDVGGSAWKVEYVDFEDRAAAVEALDLDLDNIADDWPAYLMTESGR